MSDLLEYTLRESERARNMRIRISARAGLEVVVPRGFDKRRVPALLETRRKWIERGLARYAAERELHAAQVAAGPPRSLHLDAVGETWSVEYHPTAVSGVSAREHEVGHLVLSGAVEDPLLTREALRRWLVRRAKATIVPRLLSLAAENGFEVGRASIRWQRSRWGSCSPSGTVSLNAQLLFLPPRLVDYVLLHELCHTVRLDHSPAFWALLESVEPTHSQFKRELREAGWIHVPAWLRD